MPGKLLQRACGKGNWSAVVIVGRRVLPMLLLAYVNSCLCYWSGYDLGRLHIIYRRLPRLENHRLGFEPLC